MRELLRGRRRNAVGLRLAGRTVVSCALAAGLVAAAVGVHAAPEQDVSPLSVRLTSPLGRIGTPGTVRVVAQITAPVDAVLNPVRFFVDDVLLGVDDHGPPYAVDWDDINPFEPRVIAVEVSDSIGRTARDAVSLEPFEIVDVSQVMSVLLEATVYDEHNRFVHGLQPSAFTLLEDDVLQSIDFLAKETVPSTFGLLVDSSQSMSRRMGFVRRAAEQITTYLRPDDRVLVVPFAHGVDAVTGPTNDRATVGEAIAAIETGGGTAILDSLAWLARRLELIGGRRSIILVTDGYDEDSEATFDEALEAIKKAEVAVYVVAIAGVAGISLEGERLLRRLASESGGMAFFPARARDLVEVYDALATDAQNRYLVSYTPSNQAIDGTWRNIRLFARDDRYVLSGVREGYYAPDPPPIRPTIEFTVTDTHGRYVPVSAADLVVLEDGVEQTVDTFQEAVTPVSIILALDSSGSMRKVTESVVLAGRSFVESLRPEDALAVILFGDHPTLAHDLSTDRTESFEAIDNYAASGGTALYDALYDGLTRLKREDGRRAVVVVTDGRDEDNPGTGPGSLRSFGEVVALLRETGATLFAIGIGSQVARTPLEALARASGGQAYFPADVSGLRDDYDRIVENLRRRFVLRYTSTNSTRDGSWRTVEITPTSSEFVAVSRGGYVTPPLERASQSR